MVIKHNMNAMNAQRQYGIVADSVSKSTEKLSSGYKINRAADDAAGLAISEKMRKQIRGLDRASVNAEDGISCVQTAEGAMNEVQDMLQRMNELCVQAANGTNSVTDRQYIQDEIDQLISEIDRVSETTKFNELSLLKGDEKNGYDEVCITEYTVSYVRNPITISSTSIMPYKVTYTGTNNIFMVPNTIFTSSQGTDISVDIIQDGDDVTDYLVESQNAGNKANGTLNIDKYATFVTVELVSTVMTGKSGKVHGELATTTPQEKYAYDLSTNGYTDVVRANRELFIYDTQSETVERINAGAQMTSYLNPDNTLKDRYRLLDILTADSQYVNNVQSTPTEVKYIYTGPDTTLYKSYYVSGTGTDEVYVLDTLQVTTGQDMTDEMDKGTYFGIPNGKTIYDYIVTDTANGTFHFKEQMYFINTDSSLYFCNKVRFLRTDDFNRPLGISAPYPNAQNENRIEVLAYGKENDYMIVADTLDLFLQHICPPSSTIGIDLVKMEKVLVPPPRDETDSSQRVKDTLLVGDTFSWTDDLLEVETSKQKLYDADGKEVSGMELNKYFDENGNYLGGLYNSPQPSYSSEILTKEDANRPNASTIEEYIVQSYVKIPKEMDFQLHVGSESDRTNKIEVSIKNLSSYGLGIAMLSSNRIGIVDTTGDFATDAIDVVAKALEMVSRERSNLGAIQNRLEHTIKNLDNVVENTTAAESQIRDTDMAEEMVKYSNSNILQQAGQSMLAQANQSNQGVLSLIQ